MIALKLNNSTTRAWFKKGSYDVYILGGFYVNPGPIFRLEILNTSTNESIMPHEKFFKVRTYIRDARAVDFYDLEIGTDGAYEISVSNVDDIVVKRSMLFSMRLFQDPLPLDRLEIVIKGSYGLSSYILP